MTQCASQSEWSARPSRLVRLVQQHSGKENANISRENARVSILLSTDCALTSMLSYRSQLRKFYSVAKVNPLDLSKQHILNIYVAAFTAPTLPKINGKEVTVTPFHALAKGMVPSSEVNTLSLYATLLPRTESSFKPSLPRHLCVAHSKGPSFEA